MNIDRNYTRRTQSSNIVKDERIHLRNHGAGAGLSLACMTIRVEGDNFCGLWVKIKLLQSLEKKLFLWNKFGNLSFYGVLLSKKGLTKTYETHKYDRIPHMFLLKYISSLIENRFNKFE